MTRQKKTEVTDIGNRFSRDRPTGFTCPGRRVNNDPSFTLAVVHMLRRPPNLSPQSWFALWSSALSPFPFFYQGPRRAPDRVKISSAKHENFSVAGGAFPCAQLALLLFSSSLIIDAPPRSPVATAREIRWEKYFAACARERAKKSGRE